MATLAESEAAWESEDAIETVECCALNRDEGEGKRRSLSRSSLLSTIQRALRAKMRGNKWEGRLASFWIGELNHLFLPTQLKIHMT